VSTPRSFPSRHRALALGLLLCLVAGGGYAWWRDGGKRLFQPRNWGVVEEGWLYRSGQIHARLIEDVLRDHRIDVVIDLSRDDPRIPSVQAEEQAVRRLGIRKLDLAGLNGSGVGRIDAYSEALEEIVRARDAGERVLVHCSAGSQRTGGAIALYRMLFEGWSGDRAYREYLSYRNRPPERDKLARFLNENMEGVVARLVRSGALESPPETLPVFGPAVAAAR
jgi:protein tyrosine/serine phosphatase